MQKQELIHLHALLFEVGRFLDERRELSPDAFERYEAITVRPTAIHRRKDGHRRAVLGLAADLEHVARERRAAPAS
ncbi:MAG: UPF0058 family protein [Haloarculaceae archaeon]